MSSPPACPFCDGVAVERVGRWGGQMITAQWRCQSCASYFEVIRDEFDDEGAGTQHANEGGRYLN